MSLADALQTFFGYAANELKQNQGLTPTRPTLPAQSS
jgi:hypothetical protein